MQYAREKMSNKEAIPASNAAQRKQEELTFERRAMRRERRKRQQRARLLLYSIIGGIILLLGLLGFTYVKIQGILAYNAAYPTTNGIVCDSGEQLAFHIHTHLTMYINGKQTTIPKGIGIASDGSCLYWMHTHTSDGIIHIEAPGHYSLSLDDFLNVWYHVFPKLGPVPQELNQVGWKIYVNGTLRADLTAAPLHIELPLASHDVITMDFGSGNPPPDKFYAFPANLPQ